MLRLSAALAPQRAAAAVRPGPVGPGRMARVGLGVLMGLAWPAWAAAQVARHEDWELNVSPWAIHFNQTSEHRHVYALGVQKGEPNGDLMGFSAFSNSFGQPSAYAYVGRKYLGPVGWERVYWQWTAGVLYGYKGKYKNKVPLNTGGFSPGVIPSLGYQLGDRSSVQMTFLGNSALMVNFTWSLR
jgi:hypothetical protein